MKTRAYCPIPVPKVAIHSKPRSISTSTRQASPQEMSWGGAARRGSASSLLCGLIIHPGSGVSKSKQQGTLVPVFHKQVPGQPSIPTPWELSRLLIARLSVGAGSVGIRCVQWRGLTQVCSLTAAVPHPQTHSPQHQR